MPLSENIRFERVFDQEDPAIPAIISLMREQFDFHRELYPKDRREPTEPEIENEIIRDYIRTDSGGLVKALSGHDVIGFCSYRIEPSASIWDEQYGKRVMRIEDLYVQDPYRGQGIGSAFLAYMKELARMSSAQAIELYCADANERAMSFYERHGLSPVRAKTLMRYEEPLI